MFKIKASKEEGRVLGEVFDEKGNNVVFAAYGEHGHLVLCISGGNVISKDVYNMFSNFIEKFGYAVSATITFPSIEDAGSKRLKGNVWLCSKWMLKAENTIEKVLDAIYYFCKAKR